MCSATMMPTMAAVYPSTLSAVSPSSTRSQDGVGGRSRAAALAVSAVAGLTLGVLTQLGQSRLPEALHSLVNSAAPWVLVAFAVALLGRTGPVAGVCAVLSLAASEIGYVATAATEGYGSAPTTVVFWLSAALFFGPLVGLAAYFWRTRATPWGGLGGGLVAGFVGGEGLAAYLTVRGTTSGAYWIAQVLVGLALLAFVGRRTSFGWAMAAFAIGVGLLLATRSASLAGA
jgi:hypothetical protein